MPCAWAISRRQIKNRACLAEDLFRSRFVCLGIGNKKKLSLLPSVQKIFCIEGEEIENRLLEKERLSTYQIAVIW